VNIIDLLIKHEGLRLKPYRDTVGKLTIGVGRNLDDMGITEKEARFMLENDIVRIKKTLMQTFPWYPNLFKKRKDVVVNMVFNLGITRFKRFRKLIKAIQIQDYDRAAKEMLDSKWAKQVGRRASELARMMKTGEEK